MRFDFNVYSSLLLIFAVHGLVYAIMCWRKRLTIGNSSDGWLALLLLLSCLYISPWMLGFAGWYDNQPYRDILFYVPFQHLYALGPIMFFYVQSLLNPAFQFTRRTALHFLPAALYLGYCVIILVYDKLIARSYVFLASGSDPDFEAWYQDTGFVSMAIYFVAALRYYQLYRCLLPFVFSHQEPLVFSWVRNFLVAFVAILALRMAFAIAEQFIKFNYVSDWWYFFAFSILLYYIAINGYSNAVKTTLRYQPNLLSTSATLFLPSLSAQPSVDSQTTSAPNSSILPSFQPSNNLEVASDGPKPFESDFPLAQWLTRINEWMTTAKPYEEPELNLHSLSNQLQTSPAVLSRIINQGFGVNFADFINRYRIEAVQNQLKNGVQKRKTLLGIAFDCGFNSKATFNRAFKKATGQSPREWLDAQNLA